nr:replication helicase subunit [Cyanidiaceae sp.]
MKNFFDKSPNRNRLPYNLVTERIFLGFIVENGNTTVDKVKLFIRRNFFFARAHRAIYDAIFHLYNNNNMVDWINIAFYLVINTKTSFEIVYALLNSVKEEFIRAERRLRLKYIDGKWLSLVTILAEYEAKRDYVKALIASRRTVKDQSMSFKEQVIVLQESLTSLTSSWPYGSNENWNKDAKHYLNSFINELKKDIKLGHKHQFLPTGFDQLDKLIGGFRKKDLAIIGGRPGAGKSLLAINLIGRILELRTNVKILFFSSEMPLKDILARFMIMHSKCDLSFFDIVSSNISLEKLGTEQENFGWASKLRNLYIEDSFQIELDELRRISILFKEQHPNLGLIMIDYLQIIQLSQETDQSAKVPFNFRSMQIAQIVESLKSLAKTLDVPVVLLSQLSRNTESRPGKMPTLSDLSESGSIEQQADIVILISQQQKIVRSNQLTSQHKSILFPFNLTVAKNRNGAKGEIYLGLQAKKMRLIPIQFSSSSFN